MAHITKIGPTVFQTSTESATGWITIRRVVQDLTSPGWYRAEMIKINPDLDRSRVVETQDFRSQDRAVSYARFGMVY